MPLDERVKLIREMMGLIDTVIGDISRMPFAKGSDEELYQIVRRAAVVRQREGLNAILTLCETGHGAFGVCLLRPAYEEMLWLEYLAKHPDVAAKLIVNMARENAREAMQVQLDYIGRDGMKAVGFTMKFVKHFLAASSEASATLKSLGNKLGWRQNSVKPTVSHIAQQVGRKAEYDFIYEATSKFVHFSPNELMRRAWGTHKEMHIASKNFTSYWAPFALHWGLRILMDTMIVSLGSHDEKSPASEQAHARIMEILESGVVPPIPIITPVELAWGDRPSQSA
ncbi:DUF5677 domain-containing protein [Methylobacterium aquaticum]|uniref:DUF5677 domain-containing protein n=1 Tax=Methylobacterium aquaticum TaxID=270351 RepID=UPI0019330564|nr:DUF5677 domain-containing protein [Methylobacterium aquaticum]QRE76995.1 hypothetical protein F1D61_28680 [Methylobacterium aquaticum]